MSTAQNEKKRHSFLVLKTLNNQLHFNQKERKSLGAVVNVSPVICQNRSNHFDALHHNCKINIALFKIIYILIDSQKHSYQMFLVKTHNKSLN